MASVTRAWTVGSFLLLVLLLGACGGSSSTTPTPPGGDGPFEPPAGLDVRLDTDPIGEELSVFPRIAAGGDALYVTWYDRRNGDTDVYFQRSLDGGLSWLGSDRRLDTDVPGAAGSNVPQIAAAGDRVFVVWEDQRAGLSEIRFNRSLDRGTQWLAADRRLDGGAADGSSLEVDIAAQGTHVYVVWQDNRNGSWDVYFNRSLDAGDTWLAADVRLDTDVAGAADSMLPRIAAVGDAVWVVWQDERDGDADIRLNRSTDAGATWLPADVRLDTDPVGAASSLRPRVAASSDVLAVVWQDARDGAFDIRANTSVDGGVNFLAVDRRLDTDAPGADDSTRCDVAVRDDTVHVVWEEERFGLPDVLFNVSSDGGATWGANDTRVSGSPPGATRAIQPAVALSDTHVFVTWADDRQGAFDVLLGTSADDGATWREPAFRMNTAPLGTSDALAPALVVSAGRARVVWYDDRSGPGDIYFNRAGP